MAEFAAVSLCQPELCYAWSPFRRVVGQRSVFNYVCGLSFCYTFWLKEERKSKERQADVDLLREVDSRLVLLRQLGIEVVRNHHRIASKT